LLELFELYNRDKSLFRSIALITFLNSLSAVPIRMFIYYIIGKTISVKGSFVIFSITNIILIIMLLVLYKIRNNNKIKSRITIMKVIQTIMWALLVISLMYNDHKLLVMSVLIGFPLITVFELDLLYFVFLMYKLKNRGLLSVLVEVIYEFSIIIVGVYSLLSNNNYVNIILISVISNIFLISLIWGTNVNNIQEKRNNNYNFLLKVAIHMSLLLVVTGLNIMYFITPFAFSEISENLIGFMYILSSIVSVILTPLLTPKLMKPTFSNSKIGTLLLMIALVYAISYFNKYLFVTSLIILQVILYSIALTLRHKTIKTTEESYNTLLFYQMYWAISGFITLPIGIFINISTQNLVLISSLIFIISGIVLLKQNALEQNGENISIHNL